VFFFSADDEFGEKSVSVLLDGEESEIIFIDHPSSEMSVSLFHSFVFLYHTFKTNCVLSCKLEFVSAKNYEFKYIEFLL
jgi:hypothetical protein